MQEICSEKRVSIMKGAVWALPVVLGCLPIGMAYGLMAQQARLGGWETLGLSLFVFAGASQFLAVSMLSRGVGAAAIIGTTFIVNFRHVLMSASLAPRLTSWKMRQRVMLGGMLTDESFALHSLHFTEGDFDPTAAVTLNFVIYVAWVTFSGIGFYLGSLIEHPERWGLDFALPAMFVGLLLPLCNNKSAVTAALCGGAASVAFYLLGMGNGAALVGALTGATVGVCMEDKDLGEQRS
jgi:4-azaleucine resistance transporter AzlC